MLVLRRRAGESVLIGEEIEVEVLAVTHQGAKIGIHAPKSTIVLRKELRITQEQNALAAQGPSAADFEGAVKKLRPQTQEAPLLPDKPIEN
ncbi:MAG TPA: carbon storage regulator [Bryobacteraceae bacterium]|nr:carbon storage regulator [Bryobacteraceae bacterium]